MKLIYEGTAIWRWLDEPERGLIHGKACHVRAEELSSGRVRVDVMGDGYYTEDRKVTFGDKAEFESAFLLRKASGSTGKRKTTKAGKKGK